MKLGSMERKGLSRRKGSKEEEFVEEGWVSEQEEIVCELRGKVPGGGGPGEGRWE